MRPQSLAPLALLFCLAGPTYAQVDVGVDAPGVSINFDIGAYPDMQVIPGYPVYYDPNANGNYFFYDGEYWVFTDDNWYASTWYNGPWVLTDPEVVPEFILRVPVQFYRQPPTFFQGWAPNSPPRWGDHWGASWANQHRGWDQWNHASAPRPAPLPTYQRQYSGARYPHSLQEQVSIRTQNYHYQPHDKITRQHFQQQAKAAPARPAPARATPARPAEAPARAAPRPAAPAERAASEAPRANEERPAPAPRPARPEIRKPEPPKPEARPPEAPKEAPRPEAPRPEAARPEAPRAEPGRAEEHGPEEK